MRLLVLGGTGFVGPHVVVQLAKLGHEVVVAHTGQHEVALPPGVRHLHHPALTRVGRAYPAELRAAIREVAPDVALDTWPQTEADARATLDVLRGAAGRLVAISSQDVYRAYGVLRGAEPGPPEPLPLTEDSPLRERLFSYRRDPPRSADDPERWMDDYEKVLVERAVLGDPVLPWTILRLPAVHGPKDGHRVHGYLKRMDDWRPVIILGETLAGWRWSRGYVEDVAGAIALAVADDRATGKVYNVAYPDAWTELAWVQRIAEAAGWRGEIVIVPDARLPPHQRSNLNFAQHLVVSSRRIRSELGYAERIAPAEALRRTIAWERAEPPETVDPVAFDYAAEDALLKQPG